MIVKPYTILTLALLAFSGPVRAAEKLQMYEDFFHIDSRGKQVRYIAVARFWSDIDREYLSRATRDAIAEGLTEGLTRVEGEVDLAVIGAELEAAFLDRFITTLALYKIVNKRLQVDLYFLPVPDSPVDYAPQLATNRLIRLDDTGGLRDAMDAARDPLDRDRLTRTFESIVALDSSDARYVYLGGVITVSARILDLRIDPFKVPNTAKNAVKGYVRCRRYFAARGFSDHKPSHSRARFTYSAAAGKSMQYVTVDHVSTFSAGQPKPVPQALDLHFGVLLDGYDNDLSRREHRRRAGAPTMPGFIDSVPLLQHIGQVTRPRRASRHGVPALVVQRSKSRIAVQRLSVALPSGAINPKACDLSGRAGLIRSRAAILKRYVAGFAEYLELERFAQVGVSE